MTKNVGAHIVRLRQARGLSGADLSRATGIGRALISRIENGHSGIGPATAQKLYAVLGEDVKDLVTREVAATLRWSQTGSEGVME